MSVTRLLLHDQVFVIRGHLVVGVVLEFEELVAEAELEGLEVELVLDVDLKDLLILIL